MKKVFSLLFQQRFVPRGKRFVSRLTTMAQSNGHPTTVSPVKDERQVPPLGMTGMEFHKAANAVIKDIEQYYTNLPSRPVLPSISPGYLQKLLPSSPPETAESFSAIEADIEKTIMPGITHWQHPKFMAFFPASSTYPGILAEMWSAALTAPAFNWICSPAVTELETIVLDWVAQMLGLAPHFHSHSEGGGVIQGSASEAIVTCMVAARERYVRRVLEREGIAAGSASEEEIEDRAGELRGKMVAMGSDQAHSSTKKAANISGTRFRSLEAGRVDAFALKGSTLRAQIEALHSRGLHPYYLTITLGTTNTCAVDDFASIAAVAKDYPDIWIHVDAAYAGSALLLPEYQHLSQQISFADSIDMNMHKWLLTNFDASCLFVRRRGDLTAALGITPAYLRNEYTESGLVTDYRDWQIPLGRRFRALKLWFVIRTFGVEGMRAYLRHHLSLGQCFADLVRSRSDLFAFVTPPAFALTVLTLVPPQLTVNGANGEQHTEESEQQLQERANALTKKVYDAINEQKEFFLTSSVIGGTYAIRVVSANPLAEEKYVREVFDRLVGAAEEARKEVV